MRRLFSLDELVPHRDGMRLIDEVVSVDEKNRLLTAAFAARPEWCGNYAAIEYMAQCSAALAGYFDLIEQPGCPPRPGFLLGTRKLSLDFAEFKSGERYLVTAKCEFADADAASFYCEILDGDKVIATANLNAYRPPDVGEFVKEHSL